LPAVETNISDWRRPSPMVSEMAHKRTARPGSDVEAGPAIELGPLRREAGSDIIEPQTIGNELAAESDQQAPDDNEPERLKLLNGFPRTARFFAADPDRSTVVFRRFDKSGPSKFALPGGTRSCAGGRSKAT
jgi:hypothetical protein